MTRARLSVTRDIGTIGNAHEVTALLEVVFDKRKSESVGEGVVHHSSGVDRDLLCETGASGKPPRRLDAERIIW